MKFLLFTLVLLLGPPLSAAADGDNPFAAMIDKEYADYMVDLRASYIAIDTSTDSVEANRMLGQLKEAAGKSKCKCWGLEAKMFEISVKYQLCFRNQRKESYNAYHALADLKEIEASAAKNNCAYLRLRALYGIMNLYSRHLNEYEMAFEIANTLDNELTDISADKFPDKQYILLDIANLYYFFKDYETAGKFFLKALENEEMAKKLFSVQSAYNSLGLIARNHYKELDESDEWFCKILAIDSTLYEQPAMYHLWQAIATGNIGKNHYIRKEFDKAIPLLKFSEKETIKQSDFNYAAGMAIMLADIYLEKNNTDEAKKYIALSNQYINNSFEKDKWHLLYPVMAKYYLKMGNTNIAKAYTDSAFIAIGENNDKFNTTRLLRAEQKIHAYEQKMKIDELEKERLKTKTYRQQLTTITISLIIFILLCIYLTILYRKKRRAYKELVRRSQRWAQVETKDDDPDDDDDNQPDAADLYGGDNDLPLPDEEGCESNDCDETLRNLFCKVEQLVIDEKKFNDSKISLDSLSRDLNVNRVYLSQAINRNTNKNFNTYINELRIKEAIRILSDKSSQKLSIDGIAFDAGFNDRKTFYRVFKKTTGLSPSDFKNSLN